MASELGMRVDDVERLLLAGLTHHEIRQCALINATNTYIDAFDLAIREKSRRVSFVGLDATFETNDAIVIMRNDPGGPIERDTSGKWIMHTPYVPRAGTVYRAKRFAAIGTLTRTM